MKLEGRCYCGNVRYAAGGEPMMKGQCHCRECQYITGGAPNMFVAMPSDGFSYTQGAPKQFTRSDLQRPVTRVPGMPMTIVKVGTLDDPSLFGGPQLAIYTVEKQPFHQIPEGLLRAFAALT